jgi:hypothetical protein
MRKVLLCTLAVLALSLSPARAADVTVDFGLSAGAYAPTALCALSVPDGADGIAVLDAAVEARCIESYESQDFGELGAFVNCINHICGQFVPTPAASAGTYWAFYVDGAPSQTGVSFYEASAGSEVAFVYEGFVF